MITLKFDLNTWKILQLLSIKKTWKLFIYVYQLETVKRLPKIYEEIYDNCPMYRQGLFLNSWD